MSRTKSCVRVATLAAAAAVVGACGTVERINEANRIDYKSATPVRRAALDVPPDLSAPRGDERFSVPAARPGAPATLSEFQRGQQAATVAAPRAQAGVLPATQGARIERAGTERWLVVDQPPAKLLPLVRQFWAENGFTIALDQPEIGILETDWAENRAKLPQDFLRRTLGRVAPGLYDTSERDKFRTRLEPRADGGTEIYISHRGAEEVSANALKDQFRWQMRPADPELEAEFLRRLMVRLGADQQQAQQMVAQADAGQPARARIEGGALQVDEGFDRAWRRVGLALDRAGFTVEDRDRSQGLFYVRYADVEGSQAAAARDKPGFLSRLFGGGGKEGADTRRYRVRVQPSGEASQVQVLDSEGRPAAGGAGEDRRIADRILALLQEQLK